MEQTKTLKIDKEKMKQKLIGYINELDKNDFLKNVNSEDLGSSNIRNMGNVALNCDCYQEFRLYMQYKEAKIKGWALKKEGDSTLAQVVIKHLDAIYHECEERDRETLEWISQYFGYFYWKKASIEGEKQAQKQAEKYRNGGKNYGR